MKRVFLFHDVYCWVNLFSAVGHHWVVNVVVARLTVVSTAIIVVVVVVVEVIALANSVMICLFSAIRW